MHTDQNATHWTLFVHHNMTIRLHDNHQLIYVSIHLQEFILGILSTFNILRFK